MFTLIEESFQIKENNDIELNLTSFHDCCVMAKTWEIEDERKIFEDHLKYIYIKCLEAKDNGRCINIYKNVQSQNKVLERIDKRTLCEKDEIEEFLNDFKKNNNIF